jgi:3-phytase
MSMTKTLIAALLATLSAAAPAQQLSLSKSGLQLRDAQGQLLATHAVRAKRWDQRRLADGRQLALLQDADSGELRLLEVSGQALSLRGRWPAPDFNLEALCLYLEPQQQSLQAFLIADDGLAQQWLLDAGARAPLMRHLAAAPDVKQCQVRDAEAKLYLVEPGVGLWALAADAERHDRHLLAPGLAADQLADWLARHPATPPAPVAVLSPSAQTPPVRGSGDAADDPAIWVHPRQPERSRILGTDKKLGLAVYDLQGRETQFLPVGRVNNVDLRQGLRYGGQRWDLAVASQRDRRSVLLFALDAQGRARQLAELPSGLDEVYGICSARNPQGGLDIFVNDKDGRLLQLRLARQGSQWQAPVVAQHRFASQPEGCVADEVGRQLFAGEEKRGLWRLALDEQGLMQMPQLVLPVGDQLRADVEGMGVYRRATGGPGYLVVSSQGDDRYVVLEADAPYRVRGRFRIGLNPAQGIDAVSETDGLEVSAASLGGAYRDGLVVVQDGHKRWPQGRQNFKLLPWSALARQLGLE